jgi:cell division septal protein FtsQ
VARASAGISIWRVLAALVLFASAGALYLLSVSEAFLVRPALLDLRGAAVTSRDSVEQIARLAPPPNAFRMRTAAIEQALEDLPAVDDAHVNVLLPGRLIVEVREREPVLVWQAAGKRFLVDATGRLFALAPPSATQAAAALPLAHDRRARAVDAKVGGTLDAVDLAVVRQLGAVTPQLLASRATRLDLWVDDHSGYVLQASPNGWRAIFGLYTASLRSPDRIPAQVQCLRSLLADREASITAVFLSPIERRCGTFTDRRSPSPSTAP